MPRLRNAILPAFVITVVFALTGTLAAEELLRSGTRWTMDLNGTWQTRANGGVRFSFPPPRRRMERRGCAPRSRVVARSSQHLHGGPAVALGRIGREVRPSRQGLVLVSPEFPAGRASGRHGGVRPVRLVRLPHHDLGEWTTCGRVAPRLRAAALRRHRRPELGRRQRTDRRHRRSRGDPRPQASLFCRTRRGACGSDRRHAALGRNVARTQETFHGPKPFQLPAGREYVVRVKWDGEKVMIYVNGKLDAAAPSPLPAAFTGIIVAGNGSGCPVFSGILRRIAVYPAGG